MITPGVRHNKEAWLSEGLLDLVGEGARSEAASNGMSSSVMGKLEDSTLRGEGKHYHPGNG